MITLTQYNLNEYEVIQSFQSGEIIRQIKKGYVNWVDVEIANKTNVDDLSKAFNLHHLMTEDILNTSHLPKFELFENHLFFSTKMLSIDSKSDQIIEEHLSVVIGDELIITFQEGIPGDAFDEIRERIKLGKGLIRKYKEDHLFYHALNAVVDQYLGLMNTLRLKIDTLEVDILTDPKIEVAQKIIEIKKELNILRKYALPTRDALNKMRVEAMAFVKKTSKNYYQDIADHLNFLITSFETSREMLKDLMDVHQSNQTNEMNKVIKTLTIVSAIFIPLTFLAGVYGMNFENMPELNSRWGYPMVLFSMFVIAISMGIYMRIKKWF